MDYMEQALSLARLALGETSPNPAVGAVIVKDNVIIGEGYTQAPGSYHAEIVSLKQAGEQAHNATMYVTLEPCCHYGRTPPCSKAIINAGITDVHMAMLDPNPIISGRGKAELEQAGVATHVGEQEEKAREVMEAYIKFITTGMPFVTAKFAMSLDGKIATRSGNSKWISGELARRKVHNLRYISDAIMTGANTVLIDDPQLTSRCGAGKGGIARKQPLRVIVDGKGRISPAAQLFKEPGETLIALGRKATTEEKEAFVKVGAELLEFPSKGGIIDLEELLKALGKREITSIFVEGGSFLLGSLFDRGLIDKIVVFIAPIVIGGEEAKTPIGGKGIDQVTDSLRLKRVKVETIGDDVMVCGYKE